MSDLGVCYNGGMIEHTSDPLIFNHMINQTKYSAASENERHCPFCDVSSLKDIFRQEGPRIWLKNKYPTIEDSLMTVVIESNKHLGDISTYDQEENRQVFRFTFDCWQEILEDKRYQSVLMFKNFGPRSGGTLRHPHLQIVGLKHVDGYADVSPENFRGHLVIHSDQVQVNLSDRPVMGFVEFNVIMKSLYAVDELADKVHDVTDYLMTIYMEGLCDSYNLFFYRLGDEYVCKVIPRFITSPYFIGYKIPQVNADGHLAETVDELKEFIKKSEMAAKRRKYG